MSDAVEGSRDTTREVRAPFTDVEQVQLLRQAWDVGKESGTYGRIDFDVLRREARERLAEWSKARS